MATYTTGRTRTLTFTGSISGTFSLWARNMGTGQIEAQLNNPSFSFSLPFGTGYPAFINIGWAAPEFMPGGPPGSVIWEPAWQSQIGDTVNTHTKTYRASIFIPAPDPGSGYSSASWSTTVSGEWGIEVDVEEFVDINVGSTFPTYGGSSTADPPFNTGVTFYEKPLVGGRVSVWFNSGPLSDSLSDTIPSTYASTAVTYLVSADCATTCTSDNTPYSTGHPAGVETTVTATVTSLGVPASGSYTYNSPAVGTASFLELLSAYVKVPTPGAPDNKVSITGGFAPPKQFDLSAVVRAMNSPYPANLTLKVNQIAGASPASYTISGGTVDTGTVEQQFYSAFGTINGVTDPVGIAVDQWAPVNCWIDPASLSAAGETSTDWRMLCRGYKWNAMTMTQAASMNVDNAPQMANWTAGSNTTLADSGSTEMTATISGGIGNFTSTLPIADSALKNTNWSGVSFCGYRFLRITMTADADDQPASLLIGTRQWDFTVGTDGYVDIDLCCPTNRVSSTDTKDSQWQWNGPAPFSVTDSTAWGVSNVASVNIKNLANGHEYTLSSIQLVRNDHAGMTFLPSFLNWIQAFPAVVDGSVTTTTYYRRARQGDTDGRQCREDTDVVWIHTDDGHGTTTDSYGDVAISAVVAALHTGGVPPRDGWDATDLMPNPGTCTGGGPYPVYNCYLNSDLGSIYLFGSGAIYDGSRWTYGFDINCRSSATIPAQTLFDTIDWYPGAGDVWGVSGGGYSGAIQIRAAKILRGIAYGLINTPEGAGAVDILVDIKDAATGLIDVGSGYSSPIGEYKTGAPGGIGTVSYKVTAESGTMPYPNLTGTFISRHRSRFCFPGWPVQVCCNIIFCPEDFKFPFKILMGDHTLLPLDDYEAIPEVEEEKEAVTK